MYIKSITKVDTSDIDSNCKCDLFALHIVVNDLSDRARDMIASISSTSWISALSAIDQASYTARANRTVEKLVNEVFTKVSTPLSEQFGEYMVSLSAQDALEANLHHTKMPLAELFKERVSGNSGFDFHTETHTSLVAFGEAKYSGIKNPYKKALEQIIEFIHDEKDVAELTDLAKLASQQAVNKVLEGKKAYIAAFSINADNPERIFKTVFKSEYIKPLLQYSELYLIGVEVNDPANN